jgi:primosomal protein N' (replication factor Y)
VRIVEVVPLSRTARVESLSYFSAGDVSPGQLARIDVRRKKMWGLVVAARAVEDAKAEIKSSDFELKRLGKVQAGAFFLPEFVAAARETARWHAADHGAVLASFVPSAIAEKPPASPAQTVGPRGNRVAAKYCVMDRDQDRFAEYRSVARQELARRRSVLFLVPTAEDARVAAESLGKGIQGSCFELSSGVSAKLQVARWAEAVAAERPVVVVATPAFMALPRADWGAIVIERESSPAYRTRRRPVVDCRYLAERYAEGLGCPIYLGDLMLRADTVQRYRAHEIMEHRNLRLRALSDAECEVVEISKAADEGPTKTQADVDAAAARAAMRRGPITPQLAALIEEARGRGERTFLFVGRKGLAPLLTCDDCGHTVACGSCGRPLALYGARKSGESAKAPEVRCRTCGTARAAEDKCPRCGGWRMKGLGFGTETVAAALAHGFPDAQVFVVDAEATPTAPAARKAVEKWYATPGGILVGTEMAANLAREEFECLGVVSVDALLAVPEHRMRERVLAALLYLRSHTKRRVLIQTRLKGESLYGHAIRGTLADFYREELDERREYGFPPFGLLVRATVGGKTPADAMKRAKEILAGAIPKHEPSIYPGREPLAKGVVPAHALWKLPRDPWPNPEIARALRALPPEVGLEVDTDAIL